MKSSSIAIFIDIDLVSNQMLIHLNGAIKDTLNDKFKTRTWDGKNIYLISIKSHIRVYIYSIKNYFRA